MIGAKKKDLSLCDYKRVWDMDMAENAYVGIKEYFRHFDPMHERENEIFMKLGYIDLQNISKRIKAKCMMFCHVKGRGNCKLVKL